jgi:hypothetical protein
MNELPRAQRAMELLRQFWMGKFPQWAEHESARIKG